jgi:hypothetical protein
MKQEAGLVACKREKNYLHNFSRETWREETTWENNTKMDITEIGCGLNSTGLI